MIQPAFISGGTTGTWDQCNAYCPTVIPGATMLCVNNADENDWIYSQIYSQYGGGVQYWIGYTDMPPYGGGKGTKQYGWITGCSSSYINWAPGEPNNEYNSEDYVHVNYNSNADWNDATPTHHSLCGCQFTPTTSSPSIYAATYSPSSCHTVAPSSNPTTSPSSNPTTAPSSNPTDDMWIADSPINQHVICEGDGCSLPANSTAADTEGVDSAFESSTINQQIQETLQRSQDFIRRYLNAGRQRIDSIKSKLNSTLAEQRGTKQFLTKFMMDRQTDYASAKEALQNKLKDATTEL